MSGENKNTGAGTGPAAGGDKAPEVVTLESLAAKLAEQALLIAAQDEKILAQNTLLQQQDNKIGDLVLLIQEGKATASVAGLKAVLPTIPTETLSHKKKEYRWKVAAFSLPGDPTKYTAAEANETPELIERILKINGQKILQELA